jgi:hypothetical protein
LFAMTYLLLSDERWFPLCRYYGVQCPGGSR